MYSELWLAIDTWKCRTALFYCTWCVLRAFAVAVVSVLASVRLVKDSNTQTRRCVVWWRLFSRNLKSHLRTVQLCYLGRNATFRWERGRFATEGSVNSETIMRGAVSAFIQMAAHRSVRKPTAELGVPFWIVFDHMKKEPAVWSFLPLSVKRTQRCRREKTS